MTAQGRLDALVRVEHVGTAGPDCAPMQDAIGGDGEMDLQWACAGWNLDAGARLSIQPGFTSLSGRAVTDGFGASPESYIFTARDLPGWGTNCRIFRPAAVPRLP